MKKMQVCQQFDVGILPPTCNFTKSEIPAMCFPVNFAKSFDGTSAKGCL